MNPFKVGDVVERIGSDVTDRRQGVITSISPCGTYIRFQVQKFGWEYHNYRLKSPSFEKLVELEDML
jgi:hypothetical protein